MPADVKLTMSADDARVIASIQEQKKEFKKVTDEVGKTSKQQKGLTANIGLSTQGIGKMVVGFLSFQAIQQSVAGIMKAIADDAERAANAARNVGGTTRQFLQIAGDDPALFQQLVDTQQGIVQSEGLSPEQAGEITFQAQSTGQLANVGTFAKTARIGENPVDFLNTQSTINASFGDVAPATAIGKQLAAAGSASIGVGQLRAGVVNAAGAFGAIGGTLDELLSLIAVLKDRVGSTEKAGTRIAALARKILKLGLGGSGIVAAMPALAEMIRLAGGESEAVTLLGAEGFDAYQAIADNLGRIETTTATVAGAGAQTFEGVLAGETPAQIAERRVRSAEFSGQIVGADSEALGARARSAELGNRDLENDISLPVRFARSKARDLVLATGGDEAAVEDSSIVADYISRGAIGGLTAALDRLTARITDKPLGNGNGEPD